MISEKKKCDCEGNNNKQNCKINNIIFYQAGYVQTVRNWLDKMFDQIQNRRL